jgi:hypothetical protein
MIGLTVQKLLAFWFSIGNALKVPQNWCFGGDFRGENCIMYLSKPQKAHPLTKTRVLTYYSPKSVHTFDYGPILRGQKMASGGHLGFFIFLIFSHRAHFAVSIRVYMSNLIMIGITVQKLLAFWFSIGNALKMPQNWCFGGF